MQRERTEDGAEEVKEIKETYYLQWVSWPALHGRRKRGSISNE